ncbi:MAG: glycosyltransferase family 1 protein [Thermoleophilia bacterium]|nr:glycosyltransferase family 1 protein [Thermoleophilia bacterium]
MRVALSLLTLVPGCSGGSETYVRALARALGQVGVHEYAALVPPVAPDAAEGLPTTVASSFRTGASELGRLGALARAMARPGALRATLEQAEVVHYPLTVPVPPVRRPTVLNVLDVQHLDHPELFPHSIRLFRRLAYDRAARRATRVITISAWSGERVVERLGLERDRVHVVPLAVDHTRFSPDPSVAREPFLLYPARPWPHKNHALLFEAFARLRARRPELRLVLTGAGHDPVGLPPGVESAGSVSEEALVSLYRRAAAVVFPSLYEGFGLPTLEAMACGCPVASSDAGALPETCGGAARLFDPRSRDALVEAVEEVLDEPVGWHERGLRRAAELTWEAVARAHDRVYEAAAADGYPSARR